MNNPCSCYTSSFALWNFSELQTHMRAHTQICKAPCECVGTTQIKHAQLWTLTKRYWPDMQEQTHLCLYPLALSSCRAGMAWQTAKSWKWGKNGKPNGKEPLAGRGQKWQKKARKWRGSGKLPWKSNFFATCFMPCPAGGSFRFGFPYFPHFRLLAVFHAMPARHDPNSRWGWPPFWPPQNGLWKFGWAWSSLIRPQHFIRPGMLVVAVCKQHIRQHELSAPWWRHPLWSAIAFCDPRTVIARNPPRGSEKEEACRDHSENNATLYREQTHPRLRNSPTNNRQKVAKNRILALFGLFFVTVKMIED